ncbi:MAG TPA: hypothetical protein DHU26_03190, partial [Spirochaetaceae bacterium]|nr:hypothetical protein [Spirochaetaceae bacterium]
MAINQKEIDLAYRCADLYHNHDASEFEISQKLDISRPKVSRLLALARDLGIITISIKPPELFNQIELERSLTAQYHLQNVLIGIPKDNTDASIQSAIASRFLEAFQNLLKPDIRIGIGVGST